MAVAIHLFRNGFFAHGLPVLIKVKVREKCDRQRKETDR